MQQSLAEGTKCFQQWISHPLLLLLLCGSAWLAFGLFFPVDFSLEEGSTPLPGAATSAGIAVAKRVSLFYKCFFTVFGITGLGLFLWRDSHQIKVWQEKKSLVAWQVLSSIGLGLLWLQLMGSRQAGTERMMLMIALGLLLYQIVQSRRKMKIFHFDFLFLASLSIGLAFLIKSILVEGFSSQMNAPLYLLWGASFAFLFGLRTLLHRAGRALPQYFNHLLSPLAAIPLVVVLGREFYFLCNHYALYFVSPGLSFVLILLFWLAAWLFYFSPRLLKAQLRQSEYLGQSIFPVLLVGLVSFALQQIYISYPQESFELANGANGIMRWFQFGEWPIVEWLSSHLLSDIDARSGYCLLYGYQGNLDFLAFDFIPKVVFSLLGYHFMRRAFKNDLLAFGLALILPFVLVLIPGTHAVALLTVFLLQRLLADFSKKQLLQLGVWLTFLLLWKLEIGLSSIAGTLLVLTWYFLHEFDGKKMWTAALLGLAFVAGGVLMFLAISGLTEIDLWNNFKQALDYFGAGQAHGYAHISKDLGVHFQYHYFLIPFAIGVVGLYFIFQKCHLTIDAKTSIIPLAILFLVAYYLFNAQRGLVRHGLIEGTDSFISSFAYLIFTLFLFYILKKKNAAIFWICLLILFLVQNYRHQDASGFKGYLEKVSERFGKWDQIKAKSTKAYRVWDEKQFAQENFEEFKNFMDDNFSEEATFIDFSTHPMLYFYTQRRVPSYFNQYLQNTVSQELQATNIKELAAFDIPVVVFSKGDGKSWQDNHDGIPNTVRYATLANYIKENYRPYRVFNDYNVWVKKDLNLPPADQKILERMSSNEELRE